MRKLYVILIILTLPFAPAIADRNLCNGETMSIEFDYDDTYCYFIDRYYTGDVLDPDQLDILVSSNKKRIEITNNGTRGELRIFVNDICENTWFQIYITLFEDDENIIVSLPTNYIEGEELVYAGGEKISFQVKPENDQDMIFEYDGGFIGSYTRGCAYYSSGDCSYLNSDYNIDITMLSFTDYHNRVNLKFKPTIPPCQEPLIIPIYTIMQPLAPTGPTEVNSETQQYTYYIPNYDSKATDYQWKIEPSGAGQIISQADDWVKIVWFADYRRTALLKVAPISNTGIGSFSAAKEVNITGRPGSISIYGPDEVCYSQNTKTIEYSSDFTGYDIQWSVTGTGATITENPDYEYKATVTINSNTNYFTVSAQAFNGTNPGPTTEKDVEVNESGVDIDFSNANTCSGQGQIPVTGITPSGGSAWIQNYKQEIDKIVSKHYQITNDAQAVTAYYDDVVALGRYESTTWDNYIQIDLSDYPIGMPVRDAYLILKINQTSTTHYDGEDILFGIQENPITLGNVESVWASGKSGTNYSVADYNESTVPTEIKINISHLISVLKSNPSWGIYFEYRQETDKRWYIHNLSAHYEQFKPSFEIEYYTNFNKINTNSPIGTPYTVLYEIDDAGCEGEEIQIIRIKEMPIAFFNAPSYCPEEIPAILTGGSANLSGIGRYIGDNISDDEYFISNSPGRYNAKYEFTASNGCKTQSTDDVIVFDSPDFDIYSVDEICGGNEILASVPNQSNYKRIIWDFEGNNISAGSISFTPDLSYSGYKHIEVDVTDLNGCQNTITKDIEIFETPMLAMNNQTACENSFITYYPEVVSISDGSKLNYQWSTGAITDHINLLVQRPQNISLNITSVNGCSASDDMSILMLNIPYVSVNEDEICYGESTSLKATPYLPSWSYEWSNGIKGNEITFVPKNSGENEYVVWVTDENGCINSASSNVFVNSLPEFSLEDQNVCLGDIAAISAPYGFRNYKWNTGVTGAYTINIKPDINQLISCEIQDFNGCSNSSSMTLSVITPMPLNLENVNACINDMITLEGPLGFDYYKWSNGEESRTIDVIANQERNYTLEVVDINGCSNESELEIIVDDPNTDFTASQTYIRTSDPVQFVVNSNNETSTYTWTFGDNTDANGSNVIHYYYEEGDFDVTLEIESVNHCTAITKKENYINVSENNPGLPVEDVEFSKLGVKFYPNPTSDILYIDATKYLFQDKNDIHIALYNSSGGLILDKNVKPSTLNEISLGQIRPGAYIINIEVNGIKESKKIIKVE